MDNAFGVTCRGLDRGLQYNPVFDGAIRHLVIALYLTNHAMLDITTYR